MSDAIVAIDLGRYQSVACINNHLPREHTFRPLDTTPTPTEFDRLFA